MDGAPQATDLRPLIARATGLLARIGVSRGERLLTQLPNSAETLSIGIACQLEGVVQVPLHPDLPPREVTEIVEDARPAAALVAPEVGRPEGVASQSYAPGDLHDERPRDPGAAWPLTRPMSYTSGTTGRRKGVWVGVRDESWGREVVLDEHRAFQRRHGARHLVVSPLHHSGPFRFASVTALLGGEVAVLPRFDAELLRSALREVRPTSLFCVPTHIQRLLALGDVRADDLSSLDLLAHAGAPCPVPLKEQVLELAPEGAVWEFYGSTEGQFTVCPPQVWRRSPGTVGHARPDRQLEVRDDDGRAVAEGEIGTVWVHAPEHASWEYWDAPQRTTEAWDGDAFTVGDLGHLDDGLLTLAGRPGDLVITGGVNVYPAEVERRLLEHPAVAEAVVFGVPDEEWGERVVAAVVPWPSEQPDPEEIRRHARAGLQPAKVPKEVRVVHDLPRTSTGKTERTGLAEALGFDY